MASHEPTDNNRNRTETTRHTKTNLVNVVNEVELTHILKAPIQRLYKDLNKIKDTEFTLRLVHSKNKVKCGVMTVDELCALGKRLAILKEVAHALRSLGDKSVALVYDGLLSVLLLLNGIRISCVRQVCSRGVTSMTMAGEGSEL